jgi:hypothetical protein
VVTLPPSVRGAAAEDFALRARRQGAALLELRTDLHASEDVDVGVLAKHLPLIVSERVAPLPLAWRTSAERVDQELDSAASLVSWHAPAPQTTAMTLARWTSVAVAPDAWVKHVEPLGAPSEAGRLLATQQALAARFGSGRVTVLATGPCALPFRCLLARENALDYVAFDATWAAAPGQRLLADAVREARFPSAGARRGILGFRISASRSPRTHRQPFDRIDLPEDADVPALLDALVPHYDGFAVTTPFKKTAARTISSPLPAVNTLVRRNGKWHGENTDVEGARAVLSALGAGPVTALGDGGATAALRLAAPRTVQVVRRADLPRVVRGNAVWTWPASLAAPEGLRFEDARVAVIAYGAPGRAVAERVRELGGTPVRLGPAWFVAQARGQRRLWENAP